MVRQEIHPIATASQATSSRFVVLVVRMASSVPKPILLIVENDDETRRLYADALHRLGATIIEAANAYEAYDHLKKAPVSLILTDINMPGGGIDYLARLRERVPRCPILAVSGMAGETIRQAALEAGADLFLAKPVSTRELQEAVKDALKKRGEP